MSLSLAVTFDATYFTEADPTATSASSAATNPEVGAVWDVALGGHGYMLDLGVNGQGGFRHESIPTLRPVFIEGDTLGEKVINPEGLWRFSDRDWSHGAGQRRADLPNSDTSMFWASKGIDPWTEWQSSLLPDTSLLLSTAATNLFMVVAGNYLYVSDGIHLRYTTDLVSWTLVTGMPGSQVTGLATDGYTVYAATDGDGIRTTTRGAATAVFFAGAVAALDTVAYVNGRLMTSAGPEVYNVTAGGALPSPLFTHPNPDFVWVGFAEGQEGIYAAGWSGVRSQVYRIGVDSAGTALTVPILAAPDLLGGETVLAVGSYLGFVFLGTLTGLRMCVADTTGNLQVGALITTGPVRCFDGFDRFVWFGWDDFDTTSTGLGRLDVTVESASGAPAYASDLMVTAQAAVTSVVTFDGQRVLAVSGLGFYGETDTLVTSGYLDSGLITYDIPDEKIALSVTTRHLGPLEGTQQIWLAVDDGPFTFIGSHTATSPTDEFTVPQLAGESFELREWLYRDLTFPTLGPTVTRHTLMCLPNIDSHLFLFVPLLLSDRVAVHGGGERDVDVTGERTFLYGLRETSQPVVYQEGTAVFSVTVDDLTWTPTHLLDDYSGWRGTLLLKMKSL